MKLFSLLFTSLLLVMVLAFTASAQKVTESSIAPPVIQDVITGALHPVIKDQVTGVATHEPVTDNDEVVKSSQITHDINSMSEITDAISLENGIIEEMEEIEKEISYELHIFNEQIELYPNPAVNQFKVRFSSNQLPNQVSIMSLMGQVVMQQTFVDQAEGSIDISHLAEGIYLVTVINGNDRQTLKLKVVN